MHMTTGAQAEPSPVYEKLVAMTNKAPSARVGVFGGSGFYKLLDDVELVDLSTPYGQPSDRIAIGTVAGPRVAHLSAADPYCPQLRSLAVEIGREQSIEMHDGGTVVVIQGPRFASRAESRWYGKQGWNVINMTQYPEAVLARELEMCYVSVALITDYDAGTEADPQIAPVNATDVLAVMSSNNERVRRLILTLIERLPEERSCSCGQAMRNAFIGS